MENGNLILYISCLLALTVAITTGNAAKMPLVVSPVEMDNPDKDGLLKISRMSDSMQQLQQKLRILETKMDKTVRKITNFTDSNALLDKRMNNLADSLADSLAESNADLDKRMEDFSSRYGYIIQRRGEPYKKWTGSSGGHDSPAAAVRRGSPTS